MKNNYYYYLIKALKEYRHVSYGQFDKEYRHVVKETQDAAKAIEELCVENDKLRKEIRDLRNTLNAMEVKDESGRRGDNE